MVEASVSTMVNAAVSTTVEAAEFNHGGCCRVNDGRGESAVPILVAGTAVSPLWLRLLCQPWWLMLLC